MKTITAKSSLNAASRSQRRVASSANHRTIVVFSILVFSLVVSLVSFVLLLTSDTFAIGDARKAIASIGILGILLSIASIYSLSAICWNAYWIERRKRVETESELRETEEAIPEIVRETIRQLPQRAQFEQKIDEITDSQESKDCATRVFSVVATNDLVSHQFVMDIQSKVIESEIETHAERSETV